MRTIKNLKEFYALIERYETITLEEIEAIPYNEDVKGILTGYGRTNTCSLCGAVGSEWGNPNCKYCVWDLARGGLIYLHGCNNGKQLKSYDAIELASTPKELLRAYRQRAAYMRKYLKRNNIE